MPITYTSYLKLDQLLSLQQPLSEGPEHDEVLFIVIHQVYELWFKEMLHELDHLQTLLRAGETSRAQHTLKRVLTVLKVAVHQIDILETMTPLEFLSFRERLESGSGLSPGSSGNWRWCWARSGAPRWSTIRRAARTAAFWRRGSGGRRCGTRFSTTWPATATPYRVPSWSAT